MTIKGPLYMLQDWVWNYALAHLDPKYLTVRKRHGEGFYLCRPHWPSPHERDAWLKAVRPALPIDEATLTPETPREISVNDFLR